MSEVMFINCQIVADERKTYLNGSIHVRDGKIQDIYHSPKKDYEGFDTFSDEDQDSISQIETSAQDDSDDNSDIPFFKHRSEN